MDGAQWRVGPDRLKSSSNHQDVAQAHVRARPIPVEHARHVCRRATTKALEGVVIGAIYSLPCKRVLGTLRLCEKKSAIKHGFIVDVEIFCFLPSFSSLQRNSLPPTSVADSLTAMNQLEFPTAERKKFRVNMFFPESHSYPSHEIEADSSTKCSYISQAKLTSIKWSGELRYVDDGHDCEHKPAKRVALEFVVPPGRTIEVRFCLLETPKPVMVISTSEQLWKECEKQRPLAIAPTWLRRESKGMTSSIAFPPIGAKLTRRQNKRLPEGKWKRERSSDGCVNWRH